MATDFPVRFEEKLAKVLSKYNNDLVLKDKQKIALSEFYKGRDVVAGCQLDTATVLAKVLEKDSGVVLSCCVRAEIKCSCGSGFPT